MKQGTRPNFALQFFRPRCWAITTPTPPQKFSCISKTAGSQIIPHLAVFVMFKHTWWQRASFIVNRKWKEWYTCKSPITMKQALQSYRLTTPAYPWEWTKTVAWKKAQRWQRMIGWTVGAGLPPARSLPAFQRIPQHFQTTWNLQQGILESSTGKKKPSHTSFIYSSNKS